MSSNAVAVATTLVLPRVLMLLQLCLSFVLGIGRWIIQRVRGQAGEVSGRITSHALETFQCADSIGTAASRLTQQHLGMSHLVLGAGGHNLRRRYRDLCANFQEDKWGFSIICLTILTLGSFYVGIQAIAVLTAKIMSTNYGISTSLTCGYWVPVDPTSNNNATIAPAFGPFITQRVYEAVLNVRLR